MLQRRSIILGTICFLLLIGCQANRGEAVFDADEIALGKQVYDQHCAVCHGANLEGEADWKELNPDASWRAPPHDASGHTWHHGDGYLIESVKLGGARLPSQIGVSNMPAYEGILTDEEIVAVINYIKSTWPAEIQAIQRERTEIENGVE